MGGGSYSGDVAERTRIIQRDIVERTSALLVRGRKCHAELNPDGKDRECVDSVEHPKTTPIVVAIDVTRSRGKDIAVVYGKLPMFIGQIKMKNYVSDPEISFAAVGDATFGDKAPIQIGQFESDNRLDEVLNKFWLEMGGGGTGQESYELIAYYYAKHSILSCNRRGKKGYFFFIGDEGFYSKVSKEQIKIWVGDDVPEDLSAVDVFRELQKKYHVFFVYPRTTWEQRKEDIDAEIQQRVTQAGGMHAGVDIRASLIWNNRNDLDLRVITPSGEEIYYGHKQSGCCGWLDVDMNVQGETTKPVENTRWPKYKAPKGHYKVYVQNYAFHDQSAPSATPFRVELEVNGQIRHLEGQTPSGLRGLQSNVTVFEFDYNPAERPSDAAEYAGYHDNVIRAQWGDAIPAENILLIEDPRAIVDVIMGALALTEGTADLNSYLADMRTRKDPTTGEIKPQTEERIAEVKESLKALTKKRLIVKTPKVEKKPGRI